jgi:hypothetical protein
MWGHQSGGAPSESIKGRLEMAEPFRKLLPLILTAFLSRDGGMRSLSHYLTVDWLPGPTTHLVGSHRQLP